MSAALKVEGVTVHYGEVRALDRVSIQVPQASIVGLVGMNGSGKSTLFKTIMGMVTPDRGTVRILGGTSAAARKAGAIGYVPQHEAVDWNFPVCVRDVAMMGRYGQMGWTRRPRQGDRDAVDEALERVELTDYATRQIGQLSGGQKKRAFVARALAQRSRLLLLDEPFAGVDKRSEATIVALLRSLADDGVSVLISTHDLHALPGLADEAILLNRSVILHDTPDVVLRPENLARAFGLDVLDRTDEKGRRSDA